MGVAASKNVAASAGRALPHDPALPALADLFADEGAPDVVGTVAREAGLEVDPARAEIAYVRYRPTRTCSVLYSFDGDHGDETFISAKIFGSDKGKSVLDRPRFQRRVDSARATAGEGTRHHDYLADKKLLLTVFPLDARLRGLPASTSEAWVRQNMAPSLGLSDDVAITGITPLSYKPWRRCVLRYSFADGDRAVTYYGKVFRDDRATEMGGRLAAVAETLRTSSVPWDIVTPAAYVPSARLLLFPAIEEGRETKTLMKEAIDRTAPRRELARWMAAAAEGLGVFQQTPLDGLDVVTPADLVAKYASDAASIAKVAGPLGEAVTRRVQALAKLADELAPEPLVPTHGAFRYGQLLVGRDRIVVLDLDTLCRSGASADAGNFLAYLDQMRMRRPKYAKLARQCTGWFAEALPPDADGRSGWLAWYRAVSLVKLTVRNFFSLAPAWPQTTTGLLELADAAIENPRETSVPS